MFSGNKPLLLFSYFCLQQLVSYILRRDLFCEETCLPMTSETQQLACLSLHAFSMCFFAQCGRDICEWAKKYANSVVRNLGRLRHGQDCIQDRYILLQRKTGLRSKKENPDKIIVYKRYSINSCYNSALSLKILGFV